jgi:hypothetical protein
MKQTSLSGYYCTKDFMPGRPMKEKEEAIYEVAEFATEWFRKHGHPETTVQVVNIIHPTDNPRGELIQFQTTTRSF